MRGLFPADREHANGRRWASVTAGAAALVGGTVVGLVRVHGGPGVFQTIWAEDGTYFYSDALGRPVLPTIFRPLHGYFQFFDRLLAVPTRYVPLRWGPAVLSVEAAVVTALMAVIVYLASRAHVRGTLARLLVAAPVLAPPVGENLLTTTADNVATLQFGAIYTTMWMLVWRPTRRTRQVAGFTVVLATALSTFLVVLLLPLALLRVIFVRDRLGAAMAGALALGGALNTAAVEFGLTARPAFLVPRYDPVWAVSSLFTWALPKALFGYRMAQGQGWPAMRAGIAVAVSVAVILLVVVAAARFADPQWMVAAMFAIGAAALCCGSIMSAGRLELRYVIAPQLLLFAAMAVLLRPRTDGRGPARTHKGAALAPPRRDRVLGRVPIALLAVFVLAIGAVNYWMPSNRTTQTHRWSTLVTRSRHVCRDRAYGAVYVYPALDGVVTGIPAGTPMADLPPAGWPVRLPCDRLR